MLSQLAAARQRIESSGAAVIGVGPAASYQAESLMAGGVWFPLYIDPKRRLAAGLAIGRQSLVRFVFNLAAWWRWLRAFVTNRRQYRFTGHYSNLPGIAVFDGSGTVRFLHRGTGLGDYPPAEEVVDRLEAVARTA